MAAVLSWTAVASASGAGIVVGKERHEVGRVAPLARLQWQVMLTNSTKADLQIRDVHASCSCFIPPWREQVIPAGGSVQMPLELMASGLSGRFEEHLEFRTSDPKQERVVLTVNGEVFRPVEAVPEVAMLQVTPDTWKEEVAVSRILNHEPDPIHISGVTNLHPAFSARVQTVRDGFEYLLEMRATQPLPNGNHYGQFALATTSTNVPKLEVTAFVPGLSAVALGPRAIRFPGAPAPGSTSAPVHIRSTTAHRLDVRAKGPPPAGTRILLEPEEPGRLYRLRLVTETGFVPPADDNLEVLLESNHPSYPSLRVPVRFNTDSPATPPVTAPR